MKDSITLVIARGKSHMHIIHKGEVIGKIEVSDLNRGNQCSLRLSSDKSETVYKIERLKNHLEIIVDDDMFNREEYNK